jgi:hypothetical protein
MQLNFVVNIGKGHLNKGHPAITSPSTCKRYVNYHSDRHRNGAKEMAQCKAGKNLLMVDLNY